MADFKEKFSEIMDTEDNTSQFSESDIEQNKVMAIFAYLSWLVLVPIFGAKESKFARFHVNQGLILAIIEIICWIVLAPLGKLKLIGWIFRLARRIVDVVFIVFSIIGIVNVAGGKAKDLPIIGKIRLFK